MPLNSITAKLSMTKIVEPGNNLNTKLFLYLENIGDDFLCSIATRSFDLQPEPCQCIIKIPEMILNCLSTITAVSKIITLKQLLFL